MVPTAAIQRNAQGAFVYVVKPDQTVAMRTVSVSTTDGNVAAVEGLEPGDVIVVDGFDKLQDGVKVLSTRNSAKEIREVVCEPFPFLYSSTGCDIASYGGHFACRPCGI